MTRVKICGLRTAADIRAVNAYLPEYIGFVFAPGRRRITRQEAAALKAALDSRITAVGVFVNQSVGDIVSLTEKGVIDCVQLHGDEDEGYIARLRQRFGGPIIRAAPVIDRPPGPVSQLVDYPLFDTGGNQHGGSGTAFDWTLLKSMSGPFFLAGGLHPQNVTEAIRMLRPFCVDVSSGVETGGVKNPDKIRQFIETARRV